MIANIFMTLTDYPIFRKMVWKMIYEWLAGRFDFAEWQFMNYGYAAATNETPVALESEDEIHRYPIQLYHFLVTKVDVSGKDVLEVGSGRGGGCHYIRKYLRPRRITGVDIAGKAILFSRLNYRQQRLHYLQGSAEDLPFGDEYFDVVLNVESCHAYPSVPKFLSEVMRVLEPGGHFLCTDMRSPLGMITLKKNLLDSGLELLEEEVITARVIAAIESEEKIKTQRIERLIPHRFQGLFKEFAGVKGSKIHRDLCDGRLVYHRFVLRKPHFPATDHN